VNRAMTEAFDRGDLTAVARFYADDARILGPGAKAVQGRKAIDAYWTGIKNGKSWKLEVLEVGGGAQDPWQLGRSTLISGAAGQERTSIVDFIVLWRRQPDGKLKIYVDMYVPAPKP
jgi:ketosteroid isomerase-like protein